MKYFKTLLLIVCFISCKRSDKNIQNIVGGWRLIENNEGSVSEHLELYIDLDLIYKFTEESSGIDKE